MMIAFWGYGDASLAMGHDEANARIWMTYALMVQTIVHMLSEDLKAV